jgi:lipoprotein NlpI
MAKNECEAAIASFDQAIQLKPEMASAWHGRGTSRMKLSQFDRAIADFDHALELNSQLPNTHMNRGLALLMKYEDARAQKDFDACLEINPALKAELENRIELAKTLRVARG